MVNPEPQIVSTRDAATAAVLEARLAAAEHRLNRARLVVIAVLGVIAALAAPRLTTAITVVHVCVLTPALTWAIVQHHLFHKRGRPSASLPAINTFADITAFSALLLGYGLLGTADLAVKTPIWTGYFVILAARAFTGLPERAGRAAMVATVEYSAIVVFLLITSRLEVVASPLAAVGAHGTSLLDETAKILLLVIGGWVTEYTATWNGKTVRQSVEAVRAFEERFRAVFDHSVAGVVLLDASLAIVDGNAAFERYLGSAMPEVRGRRLTDFLSAQDAAPAEAVMNEVAGGQRAHAALEARFMHREGHVAWGSLTLSRAAEEGGVRIVAMLQDVTERKALESELFHRAFHDPLTDLANRALFCNRVEHALARTVRESERTAILLLDLDNFKAVNDTLGHAAGDRLLIAVAGRLRNATRGCDSVARLGGDEFAVLVEHAGAGEGAEMVAERIIGALRDPVETAPDRSVTASVSIGIAVHGGTEGTDELLRNADVAMYEAKERARGRWLKYDPAMHNALLSRLTLEADLRRAMEQQELRLAYQPIIDLVTGQVTGFEALVRWSHSERGNVPPEVFIPMAEQSGLILSLGPWVLREACRQAAAWNERTSDPAMTITVNLSGSQLRVDSLPADVAAALGDAGLAPKCLVLEITETVIMQETESMLQRLHELKRLGVRLAIDDFGTGYSSLSYLQQFPIDILKIDRAFIDGLLRGSNDVALVRTIIALAELLGLRTIAEGVEDARQHEQLRALGCDAAQGYLFDRPLEAEEAEQLLSSRRKRRHDRADGQSDSGIATGRRSTAHTRSRRR